MTDRSLLIAKSQLHTALNAPYPIDADEVWKRLGQAGAIEAFSPPVIGTEWPGQGGIYAGLVRGAVGEADYHLILCTQRPAQRLNWRAAKAWASGLICEGHADFALPTRREGSILFANLKELFEPNWHWLLEQQSEGGAWSQNFYDGNQSSGFKSFEARARAVRRFSA